MGNATTRAAIVIGPLQRRRGRPPRPIGDGWQRARPAAPPATDRGGEIAQRSQSLWCRQHAAPPERTPAAQADRRARPLARREVMMARPARVRMRSRKPWVFARRRLFGWYVRLLTC